MNIYFLFAYCLLIQAPIDLSANRIVLVKANKNQNNGSRISKIGSEPGE